MLFLKENYKIMPQNNSNQKKSLSPENIDAICEIVKKYKLGPTVLFDDPETEIILSKTKTPEERVEIINNLPFNKIMDRLEEILEGKTSLEDLPSLIEKDLNLSPFLAGKIAKEIKESVFLSITKTKEEVLEKPSPKEKDIYREPIE